MKNSAVGSLILEKIDKSIQLVSCFVIKEPERVPQEFYLELIDLQCDTILKENCKSFILDEFYIYLNAAKFPNIQKMAQI